LVYPIQTPHKTKGEASMDIELQVTLLTITVILLSAVIIVMLAVFIAILVKIRRIMNNVDTTMQNLAQATDWLTPAKVIGTVMNMFRK
jgi:hypothetical protein